MSSDVIATERISQLDAAVCAVVFQADLAEGFRAGYGCNFSTWETNGENLRVMGLHEQPHFQNYYRVLSRAVWSSRKASQILLRHLIVVFAPTGVLVMGLDDD